MDVSAFTLHFWMSDPSVAQASHQEILILPLRFGAIFKNLFRDFHMGASLCLACEELHLSFIQAGS